MGKSPKLVVYEKIVCVNNHEGYPREALRLLMPTHRPDTTYAVVVSSTGAESIDLSTVSTDVKKIKELIN